MGECSDRSPTTTTTLLRPHYATDTDAWRCLNSVLCARSAGRLLGSALNFTGLRSRGVTGNTDHLAPSSKQSLAEVG